MTFHVKFEAGAEAEIIDAFNWYEQQSYGLGGEFLRAVDQSAAAISRNPICIKFAIGKFTAPTCAGFLMHCIM